MEVKFYKCSHCGEVFVPIIDKGVVPVCCGEKVGLLEANSTDAAGEKHVPDVSRGDDGKHLEVNIGSVPHPMTDEHLIQFVVLVHGVRIGFHKLSPGDEPKVRFAIKDNTVPVTVYEYCNLHGLWKAEI